jgi:hypothetical protein
VRGLRRPHLCRSGPRRATGADRRLSPHDVADGGRRHQRGNSGRSRGVERARASAARQTCDRGGPGGAAPARVASAHRPGLSGCGPGVAAGDAARRHRWPRPAGLPRAGAHPDPAPSCGADLWSRRVARAAQSSTHAGTGFAPTAASADALPNASRVGKVRRLRLERGPGVIHPGAE